MLLGAEEVAARLDPQRMQALQKSLMSRITITVEGNVKRKTRVLTGNLRRSWTHEVEATGKRGVVGTTVSYAPFQKNKPLDEGLVASRDSINGLLSEFGMELFGG